MVNSIIFKLFKFYKIQYYIINQLDDEIEYFENVNKRLEEQCTTLHNELFNKTNYIDDKLNDEILKLMTQKTKQINNNYELIKSKIALRESSFRNGHKEENGGEDQI